MTSGQPARSPTRRVRIRWLRVAGLLVVLALIAVALGDRFHASSSSMAPSFSTAPPSWTAPAPVPVRRREHRGALGEADGAVPDGTTVFADEIPGVANLDPALLGVLRQAAADAADEGVEFTVDSGWRSPEYQEQLLRGDPEHGSEAEAARWVATPDTFGSRVGGRGRPRALRGHGVDVRARRHVRALPDYGNEPRHFELRPEAIEYGCPPVYADPTHDPRMQQ